MSTWNSQKKRSLAQQIQFNAARSKLTQTNRPTKASASKENHTPHLPHSSANHITSQDQNLALTLRAKHYEQCFRNERRNKVRAQQSKQELTSELQKCQSELHKIQANIDAEKEDLRAGLQQTGLKLAESDQKLAMTQNRIFSLSRTKKNLMMQVSRIDDRINTSSKRKFDLKENGIFHERTRAMTHELVEHNVPIESVSKVVKSVAKTLGVGIKGEISSRSVSRINLEGGIAAKMQFVYDINHTPSITLSGDGTTHKHVNFESRCIALQEPNYKWPQTSRLTSAQKKSDPVIRFAGISAAPNHTSQEQLNGWIEFIHEIHDLWNASPIGLQQPADFREFFIRALGMGTDHANDQKKLKTLFQEMKVFYDRERRGERALLMVSPPELLLMVCRLSEEKIASAGGDAAWNSLSEPEKRRQNLLVHQSLCQEYGKKEFAMLSVEQQHEADFFVWAGCCMHKDLNSHKGGNIRLMAYWAENNLTGPITLMNKDNAAAAALGTSAAKDRAEGVSSAGAVKLTSLMGALLNHKDSKKGQQDLTAIFMEAHLGFVIRFPDTSNTRYQSHSEAAAEVIVHLPLYIQFLDHIKIKKETRTLTNLEENVLHGLRDIPTITEMCVLAAYGQAITHPYMREVRGASRKNTNVLNLGPLHLKVVEHCKKLIATPELLIGPSATYQQGSMDGKGWDRPEAIYAIQAMSRGLPHLQGATVAFLRGALETWERFSAEFAPGGDIANSSAQQRQRAWMPTTNDHNEGALGAFRVAKRKAPNMTLETHNARKMFKHNKTQAFIDAKLTGNANQSFLRQSARKLGSAGLEKQRRQRQAQYDKDLIQAKLDKDEVQQKRKQDYTEKVEAVELCLSEDDLRHHPPTVPAIELQLEWHRRQPGESSQLIPSKKALSKSLKAEKLQALIQAVNRYNLMRPESCAVEPSI